MGYTRTMFSKQLRCVFVVLFISQFTLTAAQDTVAIPPAQMVQTVSSNELDLQRLLKQYRYRVDLRLQELDQRDNVIGEFHLANEITFDSAGTRREQEAERTSTLKRISITREDPEIIRSLEDSSFMARDIDKYEIRTTGKELVNGVQCYLLELTPKSPTNGQKYFSGTVWVGVADLRIVKFSGKFAEIRGRGNAENLFPQFETNRELVDGNWLPSSMTASDTLRFSSGPVRIRLIVKYENYTKN
jgi:hypothetical protein